MMTMMTMMTVTGRRTERKNPFFSRATIKHLIPKMMRAAIPTKTLVLDMCRLAALSYLDQPDMDRLFQQKQEPCLRACDACPKLLENDEARNDGQAYVGTYNGDHLLVFRGTECIRDWLSDFNVVRVRMSVETLKMADEPLVHFGFIRQYRTLEDKIHGALGSSPSGTLHVAGHSLGGGLATIACIQLHFRYPELDIRCYTFGSPRPGDAAFAAKFKESVTASYRFLQEKDPVTATPTTWRYQHVHGGRWMFQDGTIDDEARMGHAARFFRILKHGFFSLFGLTERGLGEFHSIDKYYADIGANWDGE